MTHALGAAKVADGGVLGYRNRYCVETGDERLTPLVDAGLMRRTPGFDDMKLRYFQVTEAGIDQIRKLGFCVEVTD